MSQRTLHHLAGHILINSQARQAMLNGDREAVLRQFDLTHEERHVLSQTRANSVANLLATIEALSQTSGIGNNNTSAAHDDSFLLKPRQLACR